MAPDPTPAETQASQPLGVLKPAKPISEMTDEERREFADSMFDMLKARHGAAVRLSS